MQTRIRRIIVAALVAGAALSSVTAEAATYTVTTTSGSPSTSGSLPWAVTQANNRAGLDFINFNLPGGGIRVITISTTLFLNDQVVIDGASQPGYSGAPLIYVQGGANVTSVMLLHQQSSGSTIQGLGFFYYTSNAITILSASIGNWIQNNYIGFYWDGAGVPILNSSFFPWTRGVGIQSSFNVVRNNTISGVDNAIAVGEDPGRIWSGVVYKTNAIQYNRIGTNPAGTSALNFGNTSDGVFLGGGARENFIGPGNVLSGMASAGVELLHKSVVGNVVFANMIGVDAAGTTAIPNKEVGVLLANGANGNAIGGPWGGNVISANNYGGVSLGTTLPPGYTGAANGNWVQNNIIGLDVHQGASLGGQQVGISINSGSTRNAVTGNVLSGNTQHGAILGNVVTNSVSANFIGTTSTGASAPNGVYGIYFLNASYNYAIGNSFGPNLHGNIGRSGTSCCNVIQ